MTIYLIFIDNLLKILQNFQQIPLEFLQIFHRNFMYRLYMFCEIILITNIIFTLVTFIPHPFMYSLYMFGEIILITNIIFTLVTPPPLQAVTFYNKMRRKKYFFQNVTFDIFKITQNFLKIFPVLNCFRIFYICYGSWDM